VRTSPPSPWPPRRLLALAGCGGSSKGNSAATDASVTPADDDDGLPRGTELGPPFVLDGTTCPGVLRRRRRGTRNTGKLQLRLRAIGPAPALTAEGEVVQHPPAPRPLRRRQPGEARRRRRHRPERRLHLAAAHPICRRRASSTSSRRRRRTSASGSSSRCGACGWTRGALGGECAGKGKELHAWVNGTEVTGDPTRIVLASHQEIVIAYGTPQGRCRTPCPRATRSRRGSNRFTTVQGTTRCPRDDAVQDVRIPGDERLDLGGIVDEEHDHRAGRRLAERAAAHDLAVRLPLPDEPEVAFAKRARGARRRFST